MPNFHVCSILSCPSEVLHTAKPSASSSFLEFSYSSLAAAASSSEAAAFDCIVISSALTALLIWSAP
ncbi:hypothetical protein MBAV_006355 [Candidatus Magnetobacterium bavaricum]|uniref:Uncharacterized protein n=1 Tax=Candidatus Magnetobacterium bavaricum TaxID=29290 RepID=A0A0F3GHU4_9BACT|nr:hypothetical protein MBAV_006355 [Candidatus Magnetobacterium bavaricum]